MLKKKIFFIILIALVISFFIYSIFKNINVEEFDFIIVGSGPAGCVLANRLSENSNIKVCLIESGSDCCREKNTLPLSDDEILFPEISGKKTDWPTYVRKGVFTWGTSMEQGFHSWQWLPKFRDEPNTRGCYYNRGSNLGGSTTHSQAWIRGDTNDFDKWDTLLGYSIGNSNWNKIQMRKMYQLIENRGQTNKNGLLYYDSRINKGDCFGFDSLVHSTEGKVDIIVGGDPSQYTGKIWNSPLASSILYSATNLQNPLFNLQNPPNILVDESHPLWENKRVIWQTSLNNQDQLGSTFLKRNPYKDNGISYPEKTAFGLGGVISDFQRSTAATAYIYPIENRKNLTIKSKTFVTKIHFDNRKATGVSVLDDGYNVLNCGRNRNTQNAGYGGTPQDAKYNAEKAKKKGYRIITAKKEIILCSGVFNSPHLLLLSGIGPKNELEKFNINIIHDLKGVGKHLVDHPEMDHYWTMSNLNYDPFTLGGGFNGYYDSFPTTRIRSHVNQPTGSKYGNGQIEDYDAHIHSAVGLVFSPQSGGIIDWVDGRINIRKVGGPTYFTNRNNNSSVLPAEIPYTKMVWSLMELHKYTESEGVVRLKSSDPTDAPEIIMNWFLSPVDQERYTGAFYNNLWPIAEGMRNCDYVMDSSNTKGIKNSIYPPVTINQGYGSWFEEWVWPSINDMFDIIKVSMYTVVSDGKSPSTLTITHNNHGLYNRYNGTTSNDIQTNKHYIRIQNASSIQSIDINKLWYVSLIDANTYSFVLPSSLSAGTYTSKNIMVYMFNREKYLDFLYKNCWGHHASGTCKMGPSTDQLAVVDEFCCVYGVNSLRVVDCSISPIIHSANTQTASYIYGENVSQMIKKKFRL